MFLSHNNRNKKSTRLHSLRFVPVVWEREFELLDKGHQECVDLDNAIGNKRVVCFNAWKLNGIQELTQISIRRN